MKYDFSIQINRENTSSVKLEMCESIYGTKDIVPMWVADMDFATPPFVMHRLMSRLQHPILGYTIRDNDYNTSITGWLAKRFNWNVNTEWLSYCPGIVAGLNHAVQAFTKPKDKVMIQTPVYHPFFYAVKQNGRELVENPLSFSDGRYTVDIERFEEQIKGGVKLFVLCSPHNPVGRVWTREELSQMADICLKHKVIIVSDEIHADLVFKPNQHIPLATLSPEIANITVTFGAASKTFNIAGLATAYAVISNPQLLKRYNLQMDRNGTWHGNLLGYEATKAAFTPQGEEWLAELLQYVEGNISMVSDFLKQRLPKIKLIKPEGTYLLWLDFRGLGLSLDELKRLLVKEAKLGLNSGEMFGENGKGFQRMNVACPSSMVQDALLQLEKVFAGL